MTITDRMQQSAEIFTPLFQRLAKQRANEIAFELMRTGNLQGDPDPNVQSAIRAQLEQELALDSHVAQQQLRAQDGQTRFLNAMARLRPQQPFVPGAPIPAGDPAGGVLVPISPNRYIYKAPPAAAPTADEKAAADAAGRQILTVGGKPTLVPKPKPEDTEPPLTPFWQGIFKQAQEMVPQVQMPAAAAQPAEVLPSLPDMDKAARAEAWARKNPNDPRAKQILQLHGTL